MNFLLYILSPLLILFAPRYERVFNNGYTQAITYLNQQSADINNVFESDTETMEMALSVGFPELIRHSYLIDYFQESAMQIIYVKNGSAKSDFSIGRFQMKPSFVENIETFIIKDSELFKEFHFATNFTSSNIEAIRKERLSRIENFKWQLTYLKIFCKIMDKTYQDYSWKDKSSKILFYATAYNYNFLASATEVLKWQNAENFPHGKNYSGEQYAYGKVSVYFFEKHLPQIKSNLINQKSIAENRP